MDVFYKYFITGMLVAFLGTIPNYGLMEGEPTIKGVGMTLILVGCMIVGIGIGLNKKTQPQNER